jgi:hypothetical protein
VSISLQILSYYTEIAPKKKSAIAQGNKATAIDTRAKEDESSSIEIDNYEDDGYNGPGPGP